MRIHGWYRLGIAVSVAWLLVFSVFAMYESQKTEFETRFFFESVPTAGHRGDDTDPIPLRSVLRPIRFYASLFLPLCVIWLPLRSGRLRGGSVRVLTNPK